MAAPYRDALVSVRRTAGRLEVEAAREITEVLQRYIDEIARLVAQGDPDPSLRATRAALQALADDMHQALTRATAQRRLVSYRDTLALWERAMRRLAELEGVSLAELVAASRTQAPVTLLNHFAALNAGVHWRTALRSRAADGARDINRIVLASTAEQVSAEELGRRLRRYVIGGDELAHAFRGARTRSGLVIPRLDLRTLRGQERESGRKLAGHARRIGISEIHNGRAESELQHMYTDPLVRAVLWQLSPVRSTRGWSPPDVCDVLAQADYYGLGPGRYPVLYVPPPPHPYDRCERVPVTRPGSMAGAPKPVGRYNGRAASPSWAARRITGWSRASPGVRRRALTEARAVADLSSRGILSDEYRVAVGQSVA